jgi:hypothetical protein
VLALSNEGWLDACCASARNGADLTFRAVLGRAAWLVAAALVITSNVGAASAGLGTPSGLHSNPVGGGSAAPYPPYLAWSRVAAADHYEIQVAADSSFKAPVKAAADVITANTRLTLTKTLPSHAYWWRVRAVSKAGAASGWRVASFTLAWRARVVSDSTPTSPMRWQPVKGAAKYSVELSADPDFAAGSLVGRRPIVTTVATVSTPTSLPTNTYYWRVTPLDAEGNAPLSISTSPSGPWQFDSGIGVGSGLNAPANCVPRVLPDFPGIDPDRISFCPTLSWNPVLGASRYEVEINSDEQWAAGSRVCCDGTTTALQMTPTVALRSNKYYWRVRGIDSGGNAGKWFGPDPKTGIGNDADSFTKTFDNVCRPDLPTYCLASDPSIPNLHVEDSNGNRVAAGGTTSSPVIRWDPVPGASSYEYEVVPYSGACEWSTTGATWHGTTAVTAWTPLSTPRARMPYPDRTGVTTEPDKLQNGQAYCMRVRAQADRDKHGLAVYGDFTYLPNQAGPAFRFGGYQADCGGSTAQAVSRGSVSPSDGRQMPIFTWSPSGCAASYWVIVARDPSFTNIVDYAFTRVPAYAPRKSSGPKTYTDETTTYYWVALPSGFSTGSCAGIACDPLSAPVFHFQKQIPPAALHVVSNVAQPTFSWNPVPGARHYEFQVSQDPHFGSSFVERVTTVASTYTAKISYPPGKNLFWRVRADDELLTGLSWANWAEGQPFTVALQQPTNPRIEASGAGGITTLRWDPVPGAVAYDVHITLPSGSARDLSNLRDTQLTLSALSGTGAFRWKVRARFSGRVVGPYSVERSGTQTVWQPTGMQTRASRGAIVLTWNPVLYSRTYRVQISSRSDFSRGGESATTDNPSYAPSLRGSLARGGRFYWRVAAVDSSSNIGKFTTPRSFTVAPIIKQHRRPRATGVGVRKP